MAAPKGNRFWMLQSSYGRHPIFATPDDLWTAACEYFEWVDENPLYESKAFAYQGEVTQEPVPKMRAMTIQALCFFLDISDDTWANYCKREAFFGITNKIKQVIFDQKFSGAAADLLNANIIARELGLADKQEITTELEIKGLTDDELNRKIAELAGKTGIAVAVAGKATPGDDS